VCSFAALDPVLRVSEVAMNPVATPIAPGPVGWPHAAPAPGAVACCWAVVLYFFLGVAMLGPLSSDVMPESPACDLGFHVSCIIEARNALKEGQFPIRVAPLAHERERYPMFQFYGHLPYTVGGAVYKRTKLSPYSVWKYTVIAALMLGGFFTFRCGFLLTGRLVPALVGGAVLVMAPYMQVDVQARFAYPEMVAFCFVPVILYFSMRSFAAPGLLPIIGSALGWAGVALTHSVILFYSALFFVMFFLTYPRLLVRSWPGTLRLGLGAALGAGLSAYHLAAQYAVHNQLMMSQNLDRSLVYVTSWLTSFGQLLAPTFSYPAPVPCPPLCGTRAGYQIGWPILGGIVLALAQVRTASATTRGLVIRMALFFALAFLLAWEPVNILRHFPPMFSCALYSCRFLVFVVFWGSLLTAIGLALKFPQMRLEHLLGCLLLLGLCVGPYLPQHAATTAVTVEGEIANPHLGRGGGLDVFRIRSDELLRTGYVPPPGTNLAERDYGLVSPSWRLRHQQVNQTPFIAAPRPGDTLHIVGGVPAAFKTGTTLNIAINGRPLFSRHLPPGQQFRFDVPITESYAGDRVSMQLSTDRALDPTELTEVPVAPGAVACYVTHLIFESGGGPPPRRFVSAASLVPGTSYGRANTCNVATAEPALVQVPVLYYPKVLRVTCNGQDVPYGNLGRFVALELPPGEYHLRLTFRGIPWANLLSLVIAGALAAALALVSVRQAVRFAARNIRRTADAPEGPVLPLKRAA
jgi:hypothetical protein